MPGISDLSKWGPILVGTDGSEGAKRAVDCASALAADLNAELWIVHVVEGTPANVRQFASAEKASIGDALDEMVRRLLAESAERAWAAASHEVHTTARSGDCAEEIISAAREAGATVIFVGRRGIGGRLTQAMMGSVSQKLAGISPVLLVIVP